MSLLPSREPHVVEELTPAQRLQLGVWTAVAAFVGFLLGIRVAMTGVPALIAVPAGTIGMALFVRAMVGGLLAGAGGIARQFYNPSGSRTPSRPGYSQPESLAVRGRFEEAVAAYQAAADEEPDDPEPWLRVARIEKTDLRRPHRALEALRAARSRVAPDSPTAMLIAREIVELYLGELAEPTRAMPELGRLIRGFGDTPTGAWARQQQEELKMRMAAGEFDQWVTAPTGHRRPPGDPVPDPPDSPPAPNQPETPEVPTPDPKREVPPTGPEREAPGREAPGREVPPPGPEGPGAPPLGPGPDGPQPLPR